jgi:hypothetical protein
LIVELPKAPLKVPPEISDTEVHGHLNAPRPGARGWQERS